MRNFGAGIEGWMKWSLVDRAGRVREGGEQHNLFLNQGLDQMPLYGGFGGCMDRLLLADGAGVPAVTDTAMNGTTVESSATVIAQAITRIAPGVYEITKSMQFDFNDANGNWTQWGFRPATGAVSVKERFKDGFGAPRVVTKTAAFQLRMLYTLRVTLSPSNNQTYSFNIAGLGLVSARRSLNRRWVGTGDDNLDFETINRMIQGTMYCIFDPNVRPDPLAYDNAVGWGNYGSPLPPATVAPYVPGTFSRSFDVGLSSTASPVIINALLIGFGNFFFGNVEPGLIVAFDNPIIKDADKSLTFQSIGVSWGRV